MKTSNSKYANAGDDYSYAFERLETWKLARNIGKEIYQITKLFPSSERFGLTSQIRRAAISIPTNLAEGISRASYKERSDYTQISFGSLLEVINLIHIALDLNYLEEITFNEIKPKILELSNKLNAYYRHQTSKS